MNEMHILGLFIGGAFGAALVLAELADPDRIIGTLRLRDFHAMRTIAMFVLTSMVGVWVLDQAGLARLDIKPAVILPVLIGGVLLGTGFGMTGFCPGTGLAAGASGRLDAWVSVAGMLVGALIFILIAPYVLGPMESIWNLGQARWPAMTGTDPRWWIGIFVAVGGLVLFFTRPRQRSGA